MALYKLSVCGGTFDLLHKGHKDFLKAVCAQSKEVLVGITSDHYIQKHGKEITQPFAKRKEALAAFAKKEQLLEKISFLPIDTIYIPPQWDSLPIEAIFVSLETKFGADAINKKREKEGKRSLEVIIIPLTLAEDGKSISASRIRDGIIDRDGKPYLYPEWFLQERKLTEDVRFIVQKPFDTLIVNFSSWLAHTKLTPKTLITVGDVVTKSLNLASLKHPISVVDFLVRREKQFRDITEHGFLGTEFVINVKNPAGFITPSLLHGTVQAFDKVQDGSRVVIYVDGEEDLAVLPMLLAAPLGWTILYGQPNSGVVEVRVTEKNKRRARLLFSQFTPIFS